LRTRKRTGAESRDVIGGLISCDSLGGYSRKSNPTRRSFEPAAERAGPDHLGFHPPRVCPWPPA
jgi:hypothetical protein